MIQTVLKKINLKDVKGNFNLAHEHINFDLTKIRKDKNSKSGSVDSIVKELDFAKKQGLGLIVDLSNHSMKSNKEEILEISKKLNIPIVASTGFYLNEYETNNNLTIEEMKNLFINDIRYGFKGTNIKAGIIGEIATSNEKVFPFEEKVFRAASRAQKELNAPIYTHVDLGKNALRQVEIFLEEKAHPRNIIIGHTEFIDKNEIKKILSMNFNIGIDTVGKNNYLDNNYRVDLIKELINEGWEDKIVLSLDISKKNYLKEFGGHGYDYLYGGFLEKLKKFLKPSQIKKIYFENILRILNCKE